MKFIYIAVYFWNDAISETFSPILYIKRLKAGYGSQLIAEIWQPGN